MAFVKYNIPGRYRANINVYYTNNTCGLQELSAQQKRDIQGLVSLLWLALDVSSIPAWFDSSEKLLSPPCLESVKIFMSFYRSHGCPWWYLVISEVGGEGAASSSRFTNSWFPFYYLWRPHKPFILFDQGMPLPNFVGWYLTWYLSWQAWLLCPTWPTISRVTSCNEINSE